MSFGEVMWLGPVELVNSARAAAYLQNAGLPDVMVIPECFCSVLPADVCDACAVGPVPVAAYVSPTADPAPWYDPVNPDPDAANFLGAWVTDVQVGPAYDRNVYNAARTGGRLGPQRLNVREITVTVTLWGATCCGARYGIKYLNEALRAWCSDCELSELTYMPCCPPDGTTDFRDYAKRMLGVGTTSGLEITRRDGPGCCSTCAPIIEGVFTITASYPWEYGCNIDCLDRTTFPPEPAPTGCPSDPASHPWTEWWTGRRLLCCEVDCPGVVEDRAPIIKLYTGANDLPSARFYFKLLKEGETCPTSSIFIQGCDPLPDVYCTVFDVIGVPNSSILTFDTSTQRLTIQLPGGTVMDATNLALPPPGSTLEWPTITQQAMCVCVGVPYCADDDVSLEIDYVDRALVS